MRIAINSKMQSFPVGADCRAPDKGDSTPVDATITHLPPSSGMKCLAVLQDIFFKQNTRKIKDYYCREYDSGVICQASVAVGDGVS